MDAYDAEGPDEMQTQNGPGSGPPSKTAASWTANASANNGSGNGINPTLTTPSRAQPDFMFILLSYERPLERGFVALFLILFPLIILVLVFFAPSDLAGNEETTVGDFLNFTQFSVAHWLMPFCTAFWLSFLLCFCGYKSKKTEDKRTKNEPCHNKLQVFSSSKPPGCAKNSKQTTSAFRLMRVEKT
eukprot:g17188.t1